MIAQDSGYQGSEYIQRLGNPDIGGQSRMPSHEERDDDDNNLLQSGGYGEETMALGRTRTRYIPCISVFNASESPNPIHLLISSTQTRKTAPKVWKGHY